MSVKDYAPQVKQRVTRWLNPSEWRFVALLAIMLLSITALPYLFGYLSAPTDQVFMGLVFNVSDHTQYFSWYREFQGGFFAENKLTPEVNDLVFFNLLWWALGKTGLITGLGVMWMYQLFRLFAGFIFVLLVYWFCSLYFEREWDRRVSTLVITCGSGLGWILVLMKYTLTNGELLFPLDVYRAGTNSFLSIMAFPHFVMANSLVLLSIGLVLIGYERERLRYAVFAGVVAFILGWQHAYDLITIYGVLFVYTALESLKERKISWYLVKSCLVVGTLSCSAAIYSVYITTAYPVWKTVLDQFTNAGVFTADPFHMLILIGIPFILAVLTYDGIVPLYKRNRGDLLIKSWFLTSFFLGYLPVNYQVHLTNCWQVPVGILATQGVLNRIYPYLRSNGFVVVTRWGVEWFRRALSLLLIFLILPTSIYLLTWRIYDLNRHDYPYFLFRDDVEALNWLEENNLQTDVIFSARTLGQYIPALTGSKAFLSHWAQTVDFIEKTEMVNTFFESQTDDTYRMNLIREFGIDYILYSETEGALGSYDISNSPFLIEVFSRPRTKIYQVQNSESE